MNTDIPNEQNFSLTLRPGEELVFDLKNEILRYSDLPAIQNCKLVSKYWKEASENTLKTVDRDWKKAGENKEVWKVIGRLLRLPTTKHDKNLVRQFIIETKQKAKELINPKSVFSPSLKSEMDALILSDKVEDIHILRKYHKAIAALNFWIPLLESHGCDLVNRVTALDVDQDGNQIHKLLIALSKKPNAKPFLLGYNESRKKPFIIISFQDAAHNQQLKLDPSTKSFMRIYNIDSKIESLITEYKFVKLNDELTLRSYAIKDLDQEKAIEHIITAIKGKFEAQKGV